MSSRDDSGAVREDVDPGAGRATRNPFADDLEVVRRVLARDGAALVAFAARMQCVPRFLTTRNAQLGRPLRPQELEDVAQDTLIAVWRKLSGYRGEARLETWVCQFCEFDLRNAIRKTALRRSVALADAEEPSARGARDTDDLEAVYLGLQRLETEAAQLVRMKHFEELTFLEIAARLACSPNTVKTRYYRALEDLRAALRRSERERER